MNFRVTALTSKEYVSSPPPGGGRGGGGKEPVGSLVGLATKTQA